MPRIDGLPTDNAPDGGDLLPFIDVSADRTEAVTVANLAAAVSASLGLGSAATTAASAYDPAGSAAAAQAAAVAASQPLDADLTTLAAGTLPANLQAVTDGRYNTASLAPMARINKVTQDDGVLRVGLIGMSIASFTYALPALAQRLKDTYGNPDQVHQRAAVLGGDYTTAYQGWEKQPYCGRGHVRLRGKAASSNLTHSMFGSKISMWFSVEADSEACNIEIDGVVVGTTPAAGTQQFSVKQEFGGLANTQHSIEIVKPAGAGYVYLETLESYDEAKTGVLTYDWTIGGHSLKTMRVPFNAAGGQVSAVTLADDAGVEGHFANTEIDLYVVMHDVNDVGSSSDLNTYAIPIFNRMVELTRDRVAPVVLVSSMAGNTGWAAAGATTAANYNTLRDLYISTSLSESHVTHVDWHGATWLDDIEQYAATYYSAATITDVEAGTYTGDFIHPDATAHAALQHEFAKVFGLPPADAKVPENLIRERWIRRAQTIRPSTTPVTRTSYRLVADPGECTLNGTTDTLTTATAHGLAVGDLLLFSPHSIGFTGWPGGPMWVHSVPTSTTFTVSETAGGAQWTTSDTGTERNVQRVLRVASRQFQAPSETGLWPLWYAGVSTLSEAGFAEVSVHFDADAYSADGFYFAGTERAAIQSSPAGTDEYGKYINWSTNTNVYVHSELCRDGQVAYLLVRYSGRLSVRPEAGGGANYFLDTNLDALPSVATPSVTFPITEIGDTPITAVIPVQTVNDSSSYVTMTGTTNRIYDLAISPSPIWPGL